MVLAATPLEKIFRLMPAQKQALRKLGLSTARDLLFHFPARYQTVEDVKPIGELVDGEQAAIQGTISHIESVITFRRRTPATEATVSDESGELKVTWFRQPYLAKMFAEGAAVRITGKAALRGRTITMANPAIEAALNVSVVGGGSDVGAFPVYPESRGITSRWLYYAIQRLLKRGLLTTLEDPIPPEILTRYHLPTLATALVWIHSPRQVKDSEAARKRFSFEEIFLIQLAKQSDRQAIEQSPTFRIQTAKEGLAGFMARFPFEPTGAQRRAIESILADFARGTPMSRLLEGDVGSGKTFVAAATAYAAVTTRPEGQDFGTLQVAYMAPTEILARQHFESFTRLFAHLPLNIGLITGSGCKKFPSKVRPDASTDISRTQLLRWVLNGEIPILFGTHALIQQAVRFKHLAYVIIDEQHRFGTAQRQKLARKESRVPHLLSMTATPIPRTLALTMYGDLDLTLLDEMPAGRKPVITRLMTPSKRSEMYEVVRREIILGRQAYIICPRINEPDPEKALALQARSVTEEAARLQSEVFPEYKIGILHGKTKPKDRDAIMGQFAAGKIDLLVATSVVEVGVNVPNATTIVIEGAERFGLAQLHQLRGRVIRSTHQSYCFLVSESKSETSVRRLEALGQAKNGFELAELDLKMRGPGALVGRRQWGISDVGMEALQNLKMVEAARIEARKLVDEDPKLAAYPFLKTLTDQKTAGLHFE
jgi:ATP-dependent DNA helicase RecG